MKQKINVDDFLQGSRDCQQGLPHKHKSESYDRGYACEYEREQVMTEVSLKQNLTERRYQ